MAHNEFINRQNTVKMNLKESGLDAGIFFHPLRIRYLTNFEHLSTERPIALVIPTEGKPVVFLPRLEEDHFNYLCPNTMQTWVYFEYPGKIHPLELLAVKIQNTFGCNLRLGLDLDGFMDQNGYRGPLFSEIWDGPCQPVGVMINNMRQVKSNWEQTRMRAAGRWASIVHRYLQDEISTRFDEIEISQNAEQKALIELENYQKNYHEFKTITLHASFRSGDRTAYPHSGMSHRMLEPGDTLVSYCQGVVDGYYTELERTMYFGEPGPAKRHYMDIVRRAQQTALDMIKPGIACLAVDDAVNQIFSNFDCNKFALHHQGHGLGLEFHESPFLDTGDPTILEEGMVISVEPGLYVPGLGGFRNSDTVLITTTGVDILTPYYTEIDRLVIKPG